VGDVVVAGGENDGHGQNGQGNFSRQRGASWLGAKQHHAGTEQTHGSPHDQKRNAVNASDGTDLQQRRHLKLRTAEQAPGKAAEEAAPDHFESDPEGGAENGPTQAA